MLRLDFTLADLSLPQQRETTRWVSISGVQDKVQLHRQGMRFVPVASGGDYILKPVPSHSSARFVYDIPANETIGYSRRGTLTRNSRIAAIPIGYADGLNRHLGRGACYCLVNGQKAPYVGNICMDVAMIDVTDIDCKEGDSVEIFGEHLPVTVLSDVLDTIPYEVLTGVSNRVKKVYFQD